ncbi:MAG: hypothetical protein ABSG05_00255 [Candidatus Pacearchaeota archaeon]|jgi:hypothetical protein
MKKYFHRYHTEEEENVTGRVEGQIVDLGNVHVTRDFIEIPVKYKGKEVLVVQVHETRGIRLVNYVIVPGYLVRQVNRMFSIVNPVTDKKDKKSLESKLVSGGVKGTINFW